MSGGLGLGAATVVSACAHAGLGHARPALAVTIDDFRVVDTPRLTGAARHDAILAALDHHGIKAGGFPAGKFVDDAAGVDHLRTWAARGHLVGNHSYTHSYFGGKSPETMMADVLRAEPLLSTYPTSAKLFRFPYLAEGKIAEGRDRMRALLRENGYRIAAVTIDTSDWYVNDRLVARLTTDPSADIAPYRRYYLDHLWSRATFYDGLAKRVLGRSPMHVVLMHHSLLNGLFLDDALAMFKAREWDLIDASRAFNDPIYARSPATLPAGQSLIWALAKEHGGFDAELRYPGEDDTFEKPAMDRLGL